MIRYDESEFEAGTDNPCYQDDNITIKCNWQDEDAYPFGYWEVNFDGEEKFIVGDNGSMHSNACGKAAREYFVSCYMSEVEEDAEIVETAWKKYEDAQKLANDAYTAYKNELSKFIEKHGGYHKTVTSPTTLFDFFFDHFLF